MFAHPTKDVLIVDDDDRERQMICIAFTKAGLACDEANHGLAALEKLRMTDYLLVLLDLMMPRLDAAGVLEAFQVWQRAPERKPIILIMTGFPEAIDRLPADSVQAVIRKPFDLNELIPIVAGCVATRRAHALSH